MLLTFFNRYPNWQTKCHSPSLPNPAPTSATEVVGLVKLSSALGANGLRPCLHLFAKKAEDKSVPTLIDVVAIALETSMHIDWNTEINPFRFLIPFVFDLPLAISPRLGADRPDGLNPCVPRVILDKRYALNFKQGPSLYPTHTRQTFPISSLNVCSLVLNLEFSLKKLDYLVLLQPFN